MKSRVGEVAVRLRLDDSERDRAEQTRRAIEQVVIRNALDELERRVHAQLGRTAIVRVRRLSVRWRIDREQIENPATALAMGADLAEAVLTELAVLPGPRRLRPEPEDGVVVFADDDHGLAVFLADSFEQRAAWFHPPETVRAVWTRVCAAGHDRVAALTAWLERMDLAGRVIPWLESAESSMLATESPTEPDSSGWTRAKVRDGAPDPAEVVLPRKAVDGSVTPERPVPDATAGLPDGRPPAVADERSDTGDDAAGAAIVRTEAASVWYLARLVLQLDLAEHLWSAGAREGHVLAHVALAILGGGRGDPAWRWFGGTFDIEPIVDPLPDWAATELDDKLRAALHREIGTHVDLDAAARSVAPIAFGDNGTADAIARSAAALCALFCHRLGVDLDIDLVRRHLMIPGRMILGPELRIEMPIDAIDIDVRRAGLDFDPGYLPWLDRTVRIVFE